MRIRSSHYEIGLYLSASLIVVASTLFTLKTAFPEMYPSCVPGVVTGIYAIFIATLALRPIIIDLYPRSGYREKFLIALIHFFFFIVPIFFIERRAPFSLSLVSLNIPLCFFLVNQTAFHRLYFNNLLLVAIILIERKDQVSLIPVAILLLLICCFIWEEIFFRLRKYGTEATHLFTASCGLILRYFVVVLAAMALFGGVLGGWVARLPKVDAIYSTYPTSPSTSSLNLISLIIHTALMIVLIIVTLAMLSWLQKKMKKRKQEELEIPMSRIARLKKTVTRQLSRTLKSHLGSPRDRIIFYYSMLCEELGRLGIERKPSATPSEYRFVIQLSIDTKLPELIPVTLTFEDVQYGNREISRKEAHKYSKRIEDIIDKINAWYDSQKAE